MCFLCVNGFHTILASNLRHKMGFVAVPLQTSPLVETALKWADIAADEPDADQSVIRDALLLIVIRTRKLGTAGRVPLTPGKRSPNTDVIYIPKCVVDHITSGAGGALD